MTPISKDDWEDILTDIQDQKAVLLIGSGTDADRWQAIESVFAR